MTKKWNLIFESSINIDVKLHKWYMCIHIDLMFFKTKGKAIYVVLAYSKFIIFSMYGKEFESAFHLTSYF